MQAGTAGDGRARPHDAAEGIDSVGESPQTRSFVGLSTTDSVIDDIEDQGGSGPADPDHRRRGMGMLVDIRQCLADDVVRGNLHGGRQSSIEVDRQLDWHSGSRGQGLQRDGQTMAAPSPRERETAG